jgi:hypothetical protein
MTVDNLRSAEPTEILPSCVFDCFAEKSLVIAASDLRWLAVMLDAAEDLGIEVIGATDPEELLAAASSPLIDAAIMGLTLRGYSTLAAADALKQRAVPYAFVGVGALPPRHVKAPLFAWNVPALDMFLTLFSQRH